jgi:hypothetical protein
MWHAMLRFGQNQPPHGIDPCCLQLWHFEHVDLGCRAHHGGFKGARSLDLHEGTHGRR